VEGEERYHGGGRRDGESEIVWDWKEKEEEAYLLLWFSVSYLLVLCARKWVTPESLKTKGFNHLNPTVLTPFFMWILCKLSYFCLSL
jgi:hypothetical protein